MLRNGTLAAVAATLVLAPAATAQVVGQSQNLALYLPLASPGAAVSQSFGVTEVEVVYHRPAVSDREVWGGLVPYDQVWRTGANENTLVRFSTDVAVEGQAVPAGTYSLHTIPGQESWTVILNRDTGAWGSFSYDEGRDALRVTVRPEGAPFREQLAFAFDDVSADGATLALHWAELRVPVRITAETPALVMASIESQLKGLAQFNWVAWNQAAGYLSGEERDLDKALEWADRSIQAEERFENQSTRSQILAQLDRQPEADEAMEKALAMANAGQLHNYGRQLLGQGEKEKAMGVFERNARENPEAWFIGVGLARGHAAFGRYPEAATAMRQALAAAPEGQKAYIQGLVDQLDAGKDI